MNKSGEPTREDEGEIFLQNMKDAQNSHQEVEKTTLLFGGLAVAVFLTITHILPDENTNNVDIHKNNGIEEVEKFPKTK